MREGRIFIKKTKSDSSKIIIITILYTNIFPYIFFLEEIFSHICMRPKLFKTVEIYTKFTALVKLNRCCIKKILEQYYSRIIMPRY
jgi:hypothetical protein